MNDHAQELSQPSRGASWTEITRRFDAPPLRLAGAVDDDVSVAAEPHIVRGID
jgi:hypothetical protein